MNPSKKPATFLPRIETLETREVLSWAGIPPAAINVPSNPVAVTLNANTQAAGSAGISSTEVDYFRFTASKSGTYRLDITTPSSNLDPVLGVFSASGQRLAYNDDIVTGENTDSRLNVNLTAGQRYLFGVTNYTGTGGGSYSWAVAGPGGSSSGDDTYENNDTFATAKNLGTLTATRTISNLVMADSGDWFRFTTTGSGSGSVSVSSTRAGDIDLQLYDANGSLVGMSDSPSANESVALSNLAAGSYVARVYGYNGATNANYTLRIAPPTATSPPPPTSGPRVLYLDVDGASISRSSLVRYAGSDWSGTVNEFDSDGNGIAVSPFQSGRSDREQIINRLIQLVQQDLNAFGITVVRSTGAVVENQGATTLFLGQASDGLQHVACDIDQGNNNRTDIAFVSDEYWGSTEATAIAMADVALHEAGHTFGLWHVASGGDLESMGLRYNTDSSNWVQDTRFLDRTYNAFVSGGQQHGPGPLNTYRTMLSTFGSPGGRPAANTAATMSVDTGVNGVVTVTTNPNAADRVQVRRLAGGAIELSLNGQFHQISDVREVRVRTLGDGRDVVAASNNLGGVTLSVDRAAIPTNDAVKGTSFSPADLNGSGCCCTSCQGLSSRVAEGRPTPAEGRIGTGEQVTVGATQDREREVFAPRAVDVTPATPKRDEVFLPLIDADEWQPATPKKGTEPAMIEMMGITI